MPSNDWIENINTLWGQYSNFFLYCVLLGCNFMRCKSWRWGVERDGYSGHRRWRTPCWDATGTETPSSSGSRPFALLSINPARLESHSQVISISTPHMLSGVASMVHQGFLTVVRDSFFVQFFFGGMGGGAQAAVGFADAMFEQWAWRKIIWNTVTWRASPSGSISPKTRWVSQCCMFVENEKGAVTFVVCAHVSRASKWRLSRWSSKREHKLCLVASSYHW